MDSIMLICFHGLFLNHTIILETAYCGTRIDYISQRRFISTIFYKLYSSTSWMNTLYSEFESIEVIWIPSSIQGVINQTPHHLGVGDQLWFHYGQSEQDADLSFQQYRGTISRIHHYFGPYAMVEISPIVWFDQEWGWIVEEGELF